MFTVMCYNVLCDKYATRQLYGYCPSWALNWEYRKKGIMEEITNCDADIISLQVNEEVKDFSALLFSLSCILSGEPLFFIYIFLSAGSGDRAVLHFVSGNSKGARLRWILLSKISCQTGVGTGEKTRRWLCCVFQD